MSNKKLRILNVTAIAALHYESEIWVLNEAYNVCKKNRWDFQGYY